MELKDFGTGLLDYLRRNPLWDAELRPLVRVPYAAAEEPAPRAKRSLALVPFLAAFRTGVTG